MMQLALEVPLLLCGLLMQLGQLLPGKSAGWRVVGHRGRW